jgi:FAD/FMN-containing dehydrogenase
VPGDEGFETARLPWNRSVDQRVCAVVELEDAADAAAVVRCARLAGLSLATQPSGHGASTELDGAILVRTAQLRGLEIRPDERLARIEAGVQWGQVLAASSKHALTGLAGSSPVVNATGFCLGGGLSWFGRRYGYAANNVRALDVVDADGARSRVTADSDPDLFWALRGGGGDFALVTAIEFGLFPAPQLYGGRVLWQAARAEEVLSAFRDITADAPEELSLWFQHLQFPPFPELPHRCEACPRWRSTPPTSATQSRDGLCCTGWSRYPASFSTPAERFPWTHSGASAPSRPSPDRRRGAARC